MTSRHKKGMTESEGEIRREKGESNEKREWEGREREGGRNGGEEGQPGVKCVIRIMK